jgi:hypothetical protein
MLTTGPASLDHAGDREMSVTGEMSVSRHTVRPQAASIYRKLGATPRSQAVARACELGLLDGDGPPLLPPHAGKQAAGSG